MNIKTIRGYQFFEVSSAMQKAIRRSDARLAGYWAIELFESNYSTYVWKRLVTISAEDCAGIITKEVLALYQGFMMINKRAPKGKVKGRIFIAKAVILLCAATKSRDADHLTNLIYDRMGVDEKALEADLDAARANPEPIPDYAFDVHTQAGRKRGKTKDDFFRDEFDALKPRQNGLFDGDVEKLKGGK